MSSADIFGTTGLFVGGIIARIGIVLGVAVLLALVVGLIAWAIGGLRALSGIVWGRQRVGGLLWRAGLFYAPGHTWVRRMAGSCTVGLDDLARRLVAGATAVELPVPGTALRAGEPAATVRVRDRRAVIAAPIDCVVGEVNPALPGDPSLLERDPYARGWLFTAHPTNAPWTALVDGAMARAFFRAESSRLSRVLEKELGFAAADGGELIAPATALVEDRQWEALVAAFLGASPALGTAR